MTAISTISDLKSWVLMDGPNIPDTLVTDALKKAITEFTERSEILTEDIVITTVEDQAAYTLTVTTDDASVQRIMYVRYTDSEGNKGDPEDQATYYLDFTNGKLVWEDDYIPGADDMDYTVTVTLKMDRWADTYPSWLLARFGEAITRGAAAEILMMPGQPFSNPDLAGYRRRQFLSAIGNAKHEAWAKGSSQNVLLRP